MTRDNNAFRKASIGANVNMISEKGKQYALYIHHSFPNSGGMGTFYEPSYGEYETIITLRLEKGDYNIQYIDPANLEILKEEKIINDGKDKDIELQCPRYNLDMAIKIIKI